VLSLEDAEEIRVGLHRNKCLIKIQQRNPYDNYLQYSKKMESGTRFQEDIYSTEIVNDAVEDIWNETSKVISSNWLKTIDIPIAVDMTMQKLEKIVSWSVLEYDGVLPSEGKFEQRVAENEPLPAMIDPWARGTGIYIHFHWV
jgi:hypothetical protein